MALFARFKRLPEHEKKANEKWLKDIAGQPKEALLPLDAEDDTLYELYPSEDIDVFRGSPMNVKELAKDLAESAVFETTQEAFENCAFAVKYQNPILELKPMHYGIAVSSNVVSGNMGNHMLVGGTRKVVNKKETKDEEGEVDDAGELIKEVMAIGVNIGFRKEK